ncbi:DNA cytosine methyltransferase [Isoptericola sp. b515]|uniref:DNA cytosine methyltransferase n=1 Tax=Isoptericola sp. b515 TaxID=3064652 RepID=UPI0027122E95|nr:DNA cytosine methyltransferase [Isoptericola sp. b515]MDO8147489.1 DNA cytosine methyltransferase [Isoptericola sp. b515]
MTDTPTSTAPFRYVDLFAGIGGFAAALRAYGGEHIYAVEIDEAAAAVYERNWGHPALGDITKDANDDQVLVDPHDVLVGGFPCQAFSKSGAQRGMEEARGTLFFNIAKIIEKQRPSVVVLENVRNLVGPNHEHEWQVILDTLRGLDYRVADEPAILSPHMLPPDRGGRPQVRERIFITATYNPSKIKKPNPIEPVVAKGELIDGWNPKKQDWDLEPLLDDSEIIPGCELTEAEVRWIDAWDDFVQIMYERREGARLPGFPFWADSWKDYGEPIPPGTPAWKRSHLEKNYAFYKAHRGILDKWAERHGVFTAAFPASRRKFEWQAQDTPRLWDTVMHFRPSGIRAKRPTYLPALVAITQTSIIGPRRRRISPRETARLQGLPEWFDFSTNRRDAETYKQLGNGVNVGAVWYILRKHVERDRDILRTTPEGRQLIAAVLSAPRSPDAILERMDPFTPTLDLEEPALAAVGSD